MDLALLPAINATLNAIATVLLLTAYRAIRQKKIRLHRGLMLGSFCVSMVFLALYLLHKWLLWKATGAFNTHFTGTGIWRPLYFILLISHVSLAATVPVLAVITLFRGLKMKVEKHRKIAKITFPIWLYVSITGVLVYFMLYQWFAP